MNCLFLRRRYAGTIDIVKLLTNMSIVYSAGRDASSAGTISIPSEEIPATGLYYILSICNGYIGVWKLKNGIVNQTPINQPNTSNGGIAVVSGGNIQYFSGTYSTTGGTTTRGTLAIVQFPRYSESNIDQTLNQATMSSRLYYRNNTSSTSTARVEVSTCRQHKCVIAAVYNKVDIWTPDSGSSIVKIAGNGEIGTGGSNTVGSRIATVSNVPYLYLNNNGNVYAGSVIGID